MSELAVFRGWQKYVDSLLALLKARAMSAAVTLPTIAEGTNAGAVNFGVDNAVHPVASTGAVMFPPSGKGFVWASIPYSVRANASSGTEILVTILRDGITIDTVPIDVDQALGVAAPNACLFTRNLEVITTPGPHTISANIQQTFGGGITLGNIPVQASKVGVLTVP